MLIFEITWGYFIRLMCGNNFPKNLLHSFDVYKSRIFLGLLSDNIYSFVFILIFL